MSLPFVPPLPSSAPLKGIRVLELARIVAGPWVGQLLADLGADVIKVESPTGDEVRTWGPPFASFDSNAHPSSAYFYACNRGKKSIVADFRKPEDQEWVRELACSADIVVENFKVDGLVKYGLDYPTLKEHAPRLIYCSVTGFGQTGPYAEKPGYDALIQGLGGLMSVTGHPGGLPTKVGIPIVDILAGLYAAVGILAAVHRRTQTGVGSHIDISLLDSLVASLSNQALNYFVSGVVPQPLGNAHPTIAPYESFPTQDGRIIIAVGNDRQFEALCKILGLEDLLDNYGTNALRVHHREALCVRITEVTQRYRKSQLLALLQAQNVPAGPINTLEDVFVDPQVQARQLQFCFQECPSLSILRSPIVIDGEFMVSPRKPPDLGADQNSISGGSVWKTFHTTTCEDSK